MKTNHTPAPWHIFEGTKITTSQNPQAGALFICAAMSGAHRSHEEQAANMRLIAAAPEIQEALQDMVDTMWRFGLPETNAQRAAKTAIAKARGETF